MYNIHQYIAIAYNHLHHHLTCSSCLFFFRNSASERQWNVRVGPYFLAGDSSSITLTMPSWQRFWWSILQFRAMLLPHDLDSSPKTRLDSCFTFSPSPLDVRSEHNEMAFRSNHWWNFGLYIRVCQGSILRVGIDVEVCIFVCNV